MEICSTIPSSTSPVLILSDTESDDDAAALSKPAVERFTSSMCTKGEVDALCEKHGVPREFAAQPAGDRRACTPPRSGAVCVYAHALEAGLRFPLHDFFNEALSHFGLAPSQLTPNGWRVLVGFVVLCHSAGVPPSLAVFRRFFSLARQKGWYGFMSKRGAGALFTGLTSPKSEKEWKRGFFFLTSPDPWLCPVRWGEPPSNISTTGPVLSSNDKKWLAKLIHKHSAAVDLRTYLSENSIAAAFSSNLARASTPPPLQLSPRSTDSEGMDETVAPAEKVKAEPDGVTPELSRKKRKLEEVASAKDGIRRSERTCGGGPAALPGFRALPLSGCLAPGSPAPPDSDPNPQHSPVPETNDGDNAVGAAEPSDVVVASTYLAMSPVASYEPLELNEKQTATERDAAALREQLEEVKRVLEAEREKAKRDLAAAKQAAYEHGAEVMKGVALRLNPGLDAAKLVLPLEYLVVPPRRPTGPSASSLI